MATFSASTIVSLQLDSYDTLAVSGLSRLQITVVGQPTYETSTYGQQVIGPFAAVTSVLLIGISAGTYTQAPSQVARPTVVIDLSAAQIAAPTVAQLAAPNTWYRLNGPPYALYQSNGTSLGSIGGGTSGLSSDAVQQLINTSLGIQAQTFNQQLATTNATLGGPYVVDNQSFATVPLLAAYLAQKAGGTGTSPSAPTITAAPTINDSTVDVGQTNVGVNPGTSSGGTNVARSYRWIVGGVSQASIWQPVGGLAQTVAAGGGVALSTTQVLVLEELVSYTGSVAPISNKSTNYTLNAGAAVPSNTIAPSVTGTAAPNGVLTFSAGSWTNTPTTFDYNVYDGATPALGGVLLTTQTLAAASTATLTVPSTYAGKTLVLGVVAHNATGASVEVYAQAVAVSGGVKPVQIAPVGFQVTSGTGTSPVATALSLDYGLLSGTSVSDYWSNAPSATGFTVILYRDGVSFGSFPNLTTYTPVLLDQDKTLSYSVVASNGAGASAPSTTFPNPSIQIVAQVGGGGGAGTTTSFVGFAVNGSNSVASLSIAPSAVSPAMITNDLAVHIRSNNGPVAWTGTPSGFSTLLDSFQLTANGKQVDIYSKAVTGSEPASYVSTPSSSEIIGLALVAWRKSDGTTPSILAHGQTLQNTPQTSPFTATYPSINAGGGAAAGQRQVLVIVLDPNLGESTTFTNLPAGFSQVATLDFTGSGINWQPIYVFDGPAPSSGATGTLTMTVTTSAGTAGFGVETFIVG